MIILIPFIVLTNVCVSVLVGGMTREVLGEMMNSKSKVFKTEKIRSNHVCSPGNSIVFNGEVKYHDESTDLKSPVLWVILDSSTGAKDSTNFIVIFKLRCY